MLFRSLILILKYNIYDTILEMYQTYIISGKYLKIKYRDFPGGAVVKNPPANVGDTGLSPGLGRSHMPRSN